MKYFMKKLSELDGTSGDEGQVRDYIVKEIEGSSQVEVDNLGNIIAFKKGRQRAKRKVVLSAHMDEVGFIATYINKDGLVKLSNVGGINDNVLLGRQLRFKNGTKGVTGVKPVHLCDADEKKKQPKGTSLWLDIGAENKEQAEKKVSLGDCCVWNEDFVELASGLVKGKALDDRFGCAAMMEMIRGEIEFDTYFAFVVQEEIGCRGAVVVAKAIMPEVAVVLETTTACDIPLAEDDNRVCKVGGGAVVPFMDKGTIYDKELYAMAHEIGAKNGIKTQTKTIVAGGNDARSYQRSGYGVKTLTISAATRYLHTSSNVLSFADCVMARKLAERVVEEVNK